MPLSCRLNRVRLTDLDDELRGLHCSMRKMRKNIRRPSYWRCRPKRSATRNLGCRPASPSESLSVLWRPNRSLKTPRRSARLRLKWPAHLTRQVVGVAFIRRTVASYRRTAFAEYPRARWSAGPLKHYPEGSSSSRAVGRGDLAPSVAAKRYDKQYLFVI